MSYVIQSVAVRRDKMSKGDAYRWIRDHGYKATKVDVTPEFYRFRQMDPDRLRTGRFRTVEFGDVALATIVYF
jgi:hypothetical protein